MVNNYSMKFSAKLNIMENKLKFNNVFEFLNKFRFNYLIS